MSFDTDQRTELLGEEEDQRREAAERALHEPHDDDRPKRCWHCGGSGLRCCEFGADR